MAYILPSEWGLTQAMSSPMVVTFQPSNAAGGTSMEKLVLPQALGKAAATWYFLPWGLVTPKMSMCSANQPWSPEEPPAACLPMLEAMRSAKHFLPKSALPP